MIHPLSRAAPPFRKVLSVRRPQGRKTLIEDLVLAHPMDDFDQIRRSALHAYGHSGNWASVQDFLDSVLDIRFPTICNLSIRAVTALSRMLDIPLEITPSTSLGARDDYGSPSEWLAALAARAGGDVYLSGPGSRAYLEDEPFRQRQIDVRWQNWETKMSQWTPNSDQREMARWSCLDLLARCSIHEIRAFLEG